MSLINEALKKAQRERDQDKAPERRVAATISSGGTRPRSGNPFDSRSFRLMRALVAGGLLIGGLAGAIGLLVTIMVKEPVESPLPVEEVAVTIKPTPTQAEKKSAGEHSTPPSPPPPAVGQVSMAPPSAVAQRQPRKDESASPVNPSVAVTVIAEPTALPEIELRPAIPEPLLTDRASPPEVARSTPPAPSPARRTPPSGGRPQPLDPVNAAPRPSSLTGERAPPVEPPTMPRQRVTAGPEPSLPLVPVAKAAPDPKIIDFLRASRITGIKVAGSRSRVLMNNQVFKIGSIVEATAQLRISAIQANEIQFVDESGVEYRKQFQQ